ncbi:MAG: pilus assembly protein CpaF, partial [Reinekea sp.]
MFNDYISRRKAVPANVVQLKPVNVEQDVPPMPEIDLDLQNWLELKSSLHEAMLDRLNLSVIDKVDAVEFKRQIAGLVTQLLADQGRTLSPERMELLIEELIFEVTGLGPLEPLLADPTINDILVNNHENVYVERFGKLERTQVRFRDERHLLRIIDKIVSAMGRRVDESQPWVDARLPDGSRVNAIIRPCAVDGPSLSIRKFSAK